MTNIYTALTMDEYLRKRLMPEQGTIHQTLRSISRDIPISG
jgi:hypothetical protein